MNRQFSAFAAVGVLGVSAVMLSGCGRTPTGPSQAAPALQDPEASVSAPTGATLVAAAAPTVHEGGASLSAREAELAARERELRAQQDVLRREREQLTAERARNGTAIAEATSAFDADQAVVPAPGARTSSIQKVPTPPVVVPPGTPLQIELMGNVNARVARVGDRVEGRLAEDLVVGERRAAIAGAVVSGTVTELATGGDRTEAPTLQLTFDSLQAANGATVPIVARYAEPRELRAGTVITVPTETSLSIY